MTIRPVASLSLALAFLLLACDDAEGPSSTPPALSPVTSETQGASEAPPRSVSDPVVEQRSDEVPVAEDESATPSENELPSAERPRLDEPETPESDELPEVETDAPEDAPSDDAPRSESEGEDDGAEPTDDPVEGQDTEVDESSETESAVPGAEGTGSTCDAALWLSELGVGLDPQNSDYAWSTSGVFETSDDYNPLETSGKAPGCSLVYDALGSDVVVTFELDPGERIDVLYMALPSNVPGAIYFLDSCPAATWPDYDASGACGSNEYTSQGYCVLGQCDPLSLSLTHPTAIEGEPTGPQQYWLVLDALDSSASEWALDWTISQTN